MIDSVANRPTYFLVVFFVALVPLTGQAHFCTPDPPIEKMSVTEACHVLRAKDSSLTAWTTPIPRIIHRIWFGDSSRLSSEKRKAWAAYGERFHYEVRVWSENDLSQLQSFMRPENFALMTQLIAEAQYAGASDVLRYELLNHFGGIYLDCDMNFPHDEQGYFDFADIVLLQGLVLTTEWEARDIGQVAFFAANGLLMASPQHPVMDHLIESLVENVLSLRAGGYDFAAAFATGPYALNYALSGPFTVFTIDQWRRLGVVDCSLCAEAEAEAWYEGASSCLPPHVGAAADHDHVRPLDLRRTRLKKARQIENNAARY